MTTRASQFALLLITALTVGAVSLVYYPYSRAAAQQHNITQAKAHVNVLLPKIAGDERFFWVRLTDCTNGGGTLLVSGSVETEDDFAALKSIIESSSPPVGVTWSIEVRESASTRPSSL